jgi:hypothetical protein
MVMATQELRHPRSVDGGPYGIIRLQNSAIRILIGLLTAVPSISHASVLSNDFLKLGAIHFAARLTEMGAGIHAFNLSCRKNDRATECDLIVSRFFDESCTATGDSALQLSPDIYHYNSFQGESDLSITPVGNDGLMLRFSQSFDFRPADTQLLLHLGHVQGTNVIEVKSLEGTVNGIGTEGKLHSMQYNRITKRMVCRIAVTE